MFQEQSIWVKNDPIPHDSYAEFIGRFSLCGDAPVLLQIACDSIYNVEINGKLATFGACDDYPQRKYYDEVDITKYCQAENDIKISVWYLGLNSNAYKIGNRGLAFAILQDENVRLRSCADILSRKDVRYKNGYGKPITSQLGISFLYDNTVENDLPFEKSIETGVLTAHPRGRQTCALQGRIPIAVQPIEKGYRISWERETVGFLELDFVSPKAQKITLAYGEHLGAGKVLHHDWLDFTVEFVAKAGENQYRNAFRRLAGRYIDVECETDLDIRYIGLNEVTYPFVRKTRSFSDALSQRIYDVCVHTLVCCAHEHYEDCPWREQALYVMDCRNQMLCGYYAFEGTEFQAYNLRLIADGLRQDGLLDICFPSDKEYTIPFFSLIFPMLVHEYAVYSQDRALTKTLYPVMERILDGFESRIDETGLIPAIKGHWNYYEWTDGSFGDGEFRGKIIPTHYDLILNCAYVLSCDYFEKLTGVRRDTSSIKSAIDRNFYNQEKGLYKLCLSGEERFSQLGNSFAYLIGLGDDKPNFGDRLFDKSLIEASLSMRSFYYDALLKADENHKEYVLRDIKTRYKKMLDAGATTFWEVEQGWEANGGSASLCHGWSALPIYYLCKYENN